MTNNYINRKLQEYIKTYKPHPTASQQLYSFVGWLVGQNLEDKKNRKKGKLERATFKVIHEL